MWNLFYHLKKKGKTTVDEGSLNFLWEILWGCFFQSCSHKKRVDIFSSLLILERNPVYGTINWAKWNKNIHVSDDVEELINFSAVLEFSAKLLKIKSIKYIPKSCQHQSRIYCSLENMWVIWNLPKANWFNPLLICTWFLINLVWKIQFDELDF